MLVALTLQASFRCVASFPASFHYRPDPLGWSNMQAPRSPVKKSYHHGELRQALIDAARQLIKERQGNDFSLSDACRRAGVSTAAPYRHFADKTQIIIESRGAGVRRHGQPVSCRGRCICHRVPATGSLRLAKST